MIEYNRFVKDNKMKKKLEKNIIREAIETC